MELPDVQQVPIAGDQAVRGRRHCRAQYGQVPTVAARAGRDLRRGHNAGMFP